jgi:transcriptional regulator GlxA family with amidase domain
MYHGRKDILPTYSAILANMKIRRVAFLAVPPVQILDLTAPFEVFARCGGYRVELASCGDTGLVASSSGLTLTGATYYRGLRGPIDTLMVPGGDGAEAILCDADFLGWLRSASRRVRRVCSVCTGAFLLAAAGILDGRRAVTHWNWCNRLQQRFPRVKVDPDPIFIRDGCIYTSAGVTAGLDLALALVAEDHGSQRALEIARDLVMFLRRPGGQTQFSSLLAAQSSDRRPLQDLQAWIVEHLTADLGVTTLAARCRMSPRHFARLFVGELGVTPAHFVTRTRVTAARVLLQSTDYSMKEVASRCGFGGPDSMRRSFMRLLGVAPSDYSTHFRR